MGASGSSIAALRAPAVPEGQIGVPGRVLQDSFKRVGAEWAGANVHSGANVHFALAIRQGRVAANQLHGGSVVGGSTIESWPISVSHLMYIFAQSTRSGRSRARVHRWNNHTCTQLEGMPHLPSQV